MARTTIFPLGDLLFEWDEQKAKTNLRKHGLSFKEGATVFRDKEAIFLDDPDVFDDEVRFELLGYSEQSKMVVVVHVNRLLYLRIVSVRPATRSERKLYEEERKS